MTRLLSILAFAVCLIVGSVHADDKKKVDKKGPYKITGVDVDARKITVSVGRKEETFEVVKKAKITVRGAKDKKIDDVSLGLFATFTLNKDGQATEVVAERAKDLKK